MIWTAHAMITLIHALVAGAVGRRLAGGWLSDLLGFDAGTHASRLIWAVMMGSVVLDSDLLDQDVNWMAVPWTMFAVWFGSSVFGFGFPWEKVKTGLRAGRDPSRPDAGIISWQAWRHDMLCLTWHGVGGVSLLVLGAAYFNESWEFIFGAGLLCGPAYELAYRYPLNVPQLGCLNDVSKGLFDPPPTAELIWGALLGGSLATAFAF